MQSLNVTTYNVSWKMISFVRYICFVNIKCGAIASLTLYFDGNRSFEYAFVILGNLLDPYVISLCHLRYPLRW